MLHWKSHRCFSPLSLTVIRLEKPESKIEMKSQNVYHLPLFEAKALVPRKKCVFISHRLADIDVAEAIANFLLETVGVNVYFSDDDDALQQAVETEDDAQIVTYIENGLATSTHLLGVISNRTKGSWWVPFEIGSGRQRGLEIAQQLLEEVEYLPSYLTITKLLRDQDDLQKWVKSKIKTGSLWEQSHLKSDLPLIPRVVKYRSEYPIFM